MVSKMIEGWNKKNQKQKILSVLGIIISIIIIVLAILQMIDILPNAINIFEPLLGVLMVIQAIEQWQDNRKSAYFSLAVAIFIFIVGIVILFL